MAGERDSSFTHAMDSAIFIRFTRIAIVGASVVGLPLAGWGVNRLINRADAIADTSERTALQLQLLDQSVRLTFDQIRREMERFDAQLKDHEDRVRKLERAEMGYPARPTGRP